MIEEWRAWRDELDSGWEAAQIMFGIRWRRVGPYRAYEVVFRGRGAEGEDRARTRLCWYWRRRVLWAGEWREGFLP